MLKMLTKAREYNQNTTITHCRKAKSHRTITITRHQEDKQSNAISSLSLSLSLSLSFFPIKMIAKLERTQSNAQQNMEQQTMSNNKQRIKNNRNAGQAISFKGW